MEERRTVCWRDVLKLMYTPGLPEAGDCAGMGSEMLRTSAHPGANVRCVQLEVNLTVYNNSHQSSTWIIIGLYKHE